MNMTTLNPARRSGHQAFTLMEVLIALGLFALGFVAIAAVFPTGAHLQRQSAEDIRSRQAGKNIEALVTGIPVTKVNEMPLAADPDTTNMEWYIGPPNSQNLSPSIVREFPHELLNDDSEEALFWHYRDRFYPYSTTEQFAQPYYWVPLIQNTSARWDQPTWRVFVFMMRRQDGRDYLRREDGPAFDDDQHYPMDPDDRDGTIESDDYPYPRDLLIPDDVPTLIRLEATRSTSTNEENRFDIATGDLPSGSFELSDFLKPGDWILDDAGHIHRVASVDDTNNQIVVRRPIKTVRQLNEANTGDTFPQHIWFAPSGNDNERSPTRWIQVIDINPNSSWGQ